MEGRDPTEEMADLKKKSFHWTQKDRRRIETDSTEALI